MAVTIEELVRRRKQSYPNRINGHIAPLQVLREECNWSYIAFNVEGIAKSVLLWAMFQARIDGDIEAAFKTFAISNQYSPELAEMIEAGDKFPQNNKAEIQNNWELASHFTHPIYCSLLSGNMPLAQRLARAVTIIKLPQEPDWHDLTAHLLSTLLIDNKTLFDDIWTMYEQLDLYYGQKILHEYMQLYKAVINRDTTEYARLLKKVSEEFHLREKDKKLEDFGEYGGPTENAFVLDFMALGITYVGHQRDMRVNIDTEFFPQKLLQLIEKGEFKPGRVG